MSVYDLITRAIARAVGIVSPMTALRYLHNHAVLSRSYSGAKSKGPNQLWSPSSTSAATEISRDWRRITNRSRDLERNNCYIAGLGRRWVAGTVGEGQWPKAKVLRPGTSEINAELCDEIEQRWERWQESAGANGDQFTAIQRIVARHILFDGEILVRRTAAPGTAFALEVLEADYLDSGKDGELSDGGRIVGGIQVDRFGKPTFYHLFAAHPGDKTSSSSPYPASEILHIFERQRASQVRGICHFASIINEIFDTVEFQDATLVLARVATAFGVFVESPNPEDFNGSDLTAGTSEDGVTPLQYVNPGAVHYLRRGEKISSVKAEQPGSVYEPFVRSRLRGASVGVGVSYESFANDYSQSTYSSARQAMILERALYRMVTNLIDSKLNIPVYRWFLANETKLPAPGVKPLALPGYDRDPRPYWRVQFSRPRQEWIDPKKEAEAAEMRLDMGLDTLTDLCESEGKDFDQMTETRAAEIKRLKALGITREKSGEKPLEGAQEEEDNE